MFLWGHMRLSSGWIGGAISKGCTLLFFLLLFMIPLFLFIFLSSFFILIIALFISITFSSTSFFLFPLIIDYQDITLYVLILLRTVYVG